MIQIDKAEYSDMAIEHGLMREDATMKRVLILIILLLLTSCTVTDTSQSNINEINTITSENKESDKSNDKKDRSEDKEVIITDVNDNIESLINISGSSVQERIRVPEGFKRVKTEINSYGQYLRDLPLKPDGSDIKLFNGEATNKDVHVAVLDIDVGSRDLQQCADAVIRLRAEYLYGQGLYEKIHFNFTNGFKADYLNWMNGKRIAIDGNKTHWINKTGYSKEYSSFRKYLDIVFAYAGTLSLSKEMKYISIEDMQIGDIFLKGASPGHAVIILDMAENTKTGEQIFMIAQSYMPAQDIHILKNLGDRQLSPWYSVDFGELLSTPEWEFEKNQLMRFQD